MSYKACDKRYESMTYKRVGASGLSLSAISVGLWQNFGTGVDIDEIKERLYGAFDMGITHFDLANNYGPIPGSAEENMGRLLQKGFKAYRDELVISTKAGYRMWDGPYGDGGSRKYLIASLDASLKRLGLEYVDIFYHHRQDPTTPLEETALALKQIVVSGRALYIGLSNYDAPTLEKMVKLLTKLSVPVVILQPCYNMLDRYVEPSIMPAADKLGLGVIPFCPLAQGLLTDRFVRGITDNEKEARAAKAMTRFDADKLIPKIAQLGNIAAERGQTLAQLALSWLLRNKVVSSVLIGASSLAQIKENVGALDNLVFAAEEIAAIDAITIDKAE